jgi:hypothetical protein
MDLADLVQLRTHVSGASIALHDDTHLTLVREEDGVEVSVRAVPAAAIDPKDGDEDTLLIARWVRPVATELDELNRFNAGAAITVATAHRYENLYGRSERTYYRSQLLVTEREGPLFLKALASDLGLANTLEAPPPISLQEVQERLNATPVATAEEELLLAIFGERVPEPAEYYRIADGVLVGPSSVGKDARKSRVVDVVVRVDALGLLRVRHERSYVDGAARLPQLDSMNAESSSDESLVGYQRAFATDENTVAVEFTASPSEIGSRSFRRKVRALEIAVSSYLKQT